VSGFLDRWNKFLTSTMQATFESLSLLAVRIAAGGGLARHGWSKLNHFSEMAQSFPDPLHLGSSSVSLSLTIFGELICGLLVLIGLFTRLTAIPPLFTMCVAIFVILAQEPYDKKELAILYAVAFLILVLKGAGPVSIDGLLNRPK
jgi:putative oxidoreductase